MTDYSKLIDAATWTFIDRTQSFYAAATPDASIAEQRHMYDQMCIDFRHPVPSEVTVEDAVWDHIPTRHYARQTDPDPDHIIAYFHGGGFVVGGLDSHDDVCAEICASTGIAVVSVDYRLAPEYAAPAQRDDCMRIVTALAARDQRQIILVGDSAGGYLAAELSHRLRGTDISIAGQVLIYPGLGGDPDRGSYITHADAPLLTRADVLFYADMLHPDGGADAPEPLDDDVSDVPPTMVMAAECDPLCDDAIQYHTKLRAAGVPCRLHVEAGLVHGFLRARHSVPRASQAFARIIAACRDLADGTKM